MLQTSRFTCVCKHLKDTIVPVLVMIAILVIVLRFSYGHWSFVIVQIWAVVLFIVNITEWVYVTRCNLYDRNQSTTKSYAITSTIILLFIAINAVSLLSAESVYAGAILIMYLYKFIGIEGLYSISGEFDFDATGKCCLCCKNITCNKCLVGYFFVVYPIVPIISVNEYFEHTVVSWSCTLIVYVAVLAIFYVPIRFVLGTKFECIPMDCWHKWMGRLVFVFIIIWIGIGFTKYWSNVSYYYVVIFMCISASFNSIFFMTLALLNGSINSLVKIEYSEGIINSNVLYSIQQKKLRLVIYLMFLWGITGLILERLHMHIIPFFDTDLYFIMDFMIDAFVLTLLSLMIWFECPLSCKRYSICKQCQIQYLKHEHCEICGQSTENSKTSRNSDDDAMDTHLLNNYYQLQAA
eukprot:274995_1